MHDRPGLARTIVVYLVFLIPSLFCLAMTGFYTYGSFALGWLWLEALMIALAIIHVVLQAVFFRLARRTYLGQIGDGQFFGYAVWAVILLLFSDFLAFAFPAYYLFNG
jgi:hypothetical protein